ncbi:coiled-coil domain-containing protein 149 [Chelonus insularis]|uniref:coiled-coil domain-containing protein 149 n=1 Tax=Chelonus insularis TaxID=460826 RepID=UPI00158E61A9|nr:coiled-coil domain-containing protein 149 [Chelonus insularis]
MAQSLEENQPLQSPEHNADEVAMLRKKLLLKSEALMVLSQEYDQCRTQRDQFKLMAEQIQERFWHFKKQTNLTRDLRKYSVDEDFRTMDLLAEIREQNKCLRLQVETLRQKLRDAQRDIQVLRSSNNSHIELTGSQLAPAAHEREEMIEQLEKLNIKCTQLQNDLKNVLDEKQELVTERDAFKCKAHRLNHQLSKALNATQAVDLDALINENRYLQERLQQLSEEKELAHQSLSRYKGILDSKRVKGTIKLGTDGGGRIMTYKQVEELLQQGVNIPPQKAAAALEELRYLCAALFDTLNDKALALAHQRKTNKILATRISELVNDIPSPTSKLLEGYVSADVDTNVELNLHDYDSKEMLNDIETEEKVHLNGDLSHKESPSFTGDSTSTPTVPLDLPENLGALVQKALLDLKENTKDKS